MSIDAVDASCFEGFVGGIFDYDEDALFEKSTGIGAIFQSNIECKKNHISAMKINARPLLTIATVLADGGKWNASTTVKKDHEGNTSGSANLHVEKKKGETRGYVDVKAEVKKDKNQKVETGVSVTAGVSGEF